MFQKQFALNRKLYVAFIDFEKACDSFFFLKFCQAHRCGAFNRTTYIHYNNMFTFIHTSFCLKNKNKIKSIRRLTELSITDWHVCDIHLRIQYNHSLYRVCGCVCVSACACVWVCVCIYLGLWWWMKCSLWVLLLTISNLSVKFKTSCLLTHV